MLYRKDIFRKSQIVLSVALGTLPAPVIMLAYLTPDFWKYALLISGMYVLLSLIGILLPGKIRLIYGGAMVLAAAAITYLLTQTTMERMVLLGIVLAYGAALLFSMRIAAWSREIELPAGLIGVSVVLHFMSQFLILMDEANAQILSRVGPWLTGALIAFAGLVLLAQNRKSMMSAGGKRPVISISMRVKNLLLTVGLFAVSLLFTRMPSLISGSIKAADWLIDVFDRLKELFPQNSDLPPITEETILPTETVGELLNPGPTEEDILFAKIVYISVTIISTTILVILAAWYLRKWTRALKKYLPRLWSLLLRNVANSSEDYYEDEITDTREDAILERTEREKKDFRKMLLGEVYLEPGERIRYRYRRMAKKHPQWRRASTARENLPEEAASLYERARYSDHPISEDDARRFKTATKQI